MEKSIFVLMFAGIATAMIASAIVANSDVPAVLAKLNCDSDSCTGGFGSKGGGAGGNFVIDTDENTFTQSGGGGSKFLPGGGGGRTVCDFDDDTCEHHGGSSD